MAKPADGQPDANEFGQMVAFLASKFGGLQQVYDVIGDSPNGRTRQEIADKLRAWFKDLPKA